MNNDYLENKMIIHSFCAFGEKRSNYMFLFPAIIRQHYTFFPYDNYKIFMYTDRPFVDSDYYGREINNLEKSGLLKIIIIRGDNFWEKPLKSMGMIWRMMPLWNNDVNYFFCRDLDSILTPRQTKFVVEFLKSNFFANGINDNVCHDIPLMGGMTGFNVSKTKEILPFNSFSDFISIYKYDEKWWNQHGSDQKYLMQVLWPIIKNNFLLQKVNGPNERYNLKNNVPGIELDFLHKAVRSEGDNFTNYIGACGINSSLEDLISFYNIYGNEKYINIIKKCEL